MTMINSYQVPIQTIHSFNCAQLEGKTTRFTLLKYEVTGRVLEILIDHKSKRNPEVEAFWDQRSAKLYLTGGKCDSLQQEFDGSYIVPSSRAKITIDLSSVWNKNVMHIYKKSEDLYAPVGEKWQLSRFSEDQLLLALYKNEEDLFHRFCCFI